MSERGAAQVSLEVLRPPRRILQRLGAGGVEVVEEWKGLGNKLHVGFKEKKKESKMTCRFLISLKNIYFT